ncbi:unnamed protein product [Fusarium graminearum]|uniref:Chromosome 3, complete genome n=2 Tax=Gibberella zeae (strain ATCC MYA-4620 / CBS 123657 / FGSC 9075 / NRRL 31084 / PH-1) TaxID=229533 RepID=A0A1C3YKE9_GIBZE|nr:unnamed protein product [Fusarium graminearum]
MSSTKEAEEVIGIKNEHLAHQERRILQNAKRLLFEVLRFTSGKTFNRASAANETTFMLFKNYPDRIVIECNHDDLRRICAVRSPYVRADWYKGMRLEPDKDVILTYSNDKHTEMRSKMATGYAGKGSENFEKDIDARITELLKLIGNKMAGTDLAATTLRVAILYILTQPQAHMRLLDEFRAHGLLSGRSIETIVSIAAASNMPYLQACIKETLRICPPFCGLLEKVVAHGGDVISDGRILPKGTHIGLSFWGIMRDTDVFGDDADVFRLGR